MSARVAVVAGSTRGIGLALVKALAAHWTPNDHVYLTARKTDDGIRVLETVATSGATVDWLPFDLTDATSPQSLAATLVARHGGIDVSVMNGGFAPAHDAPPERDARPMIQTNNHGSLHYLNAMLPAMRDNGHLVIIASGLGLLKNLPEHLRPRFDTHTQSPEDIDRAMDDDVADAEAGRLDTVGWPAWINIPSKVGQVAVTRAFARRYAERADRKPGLLINAACPGLTLTDATASLMDNVFRGRSAQTPEQAAEHLLWLVTQPQGAAEPYGELVQTRRVLPFGD